jgi:hypothetical protein
MKLRSSSIARLDIRENLVEESFGSVLFARGLEFAESAAGIAHRAATPTAPAAAAAQIAASRQSAHLQGDPEIDMSESHLSK